MSNNVIKVKNLSKYYGKHRGIEDVSFTVEEGEIFGFIGPNGAGKSTTIRTLMALILPTAGSATMFGMDCDKEAHKIAKNVGYLPSEAYYYENMTVKELLKYSAELYQMDCNERINELKERLKLVDTRKISDLSFGNKKKVGIVAALLHSPKLIILDEPTNGLDPLIKETFFEILKEENKKGATILYSSHVLSEVQRICSKVAIIKEGTIINVQNMNDLRKNGYKKIQLVLSEPTVKDYFKEDNIANYKLKGNHVSFIYRGEADKIIEKIFNLKVEDVFIEEPTLEEIFLHYYK
ncbi:ABC transporter ATP-binding protein [Sedimentibacter sp. MB31-C6]|uniref:ABC transporter ATP-binding protein n=1 Tax=Sedimentibacter sp. MB31-C6 TaxID=3109366 RepID=UPI002DDD05F6|nr:ABC transporter ATP-binding protein [Sedimentibacter sp. MB36-C1]WSI05292.1 ABC transporter ATP-binding protein [Sedimentibacter sp. MB36-C1]